MYLKTIKLQNNLNIIFKIYIRKKIYYFKFENMR
jgi:hypothetical protein